MSQGSLRSSKEESASGGGGGGESPPLLRDKASAFLQSFESRGHLDGCRPGTLVKPPGTEVLLAPGGEGVAGGALEGGGKPLCPRADPEDAG